MRYERGAQVAQDVHVKRDDGCRVRAHEQFHQRKERSRHLPECHNARGHVRVCHTMAPCKYAKYARRV